MSWNMTRKASFDLMRAIWITVAVLIGFMIFLVIYRVGGAIG